jgi:hypothetical protein
VKTMKSVTGTVRNGVVVLDGENPFPEGTRVAIHVRTPGPQSAEGPNSFLLKYAGTVPDLPSDMAENHDHYAHGAPKR